MKKSFIGILAAILVCMIVVAIGVNVSKLDSGKQTASNNQNTSMDTELGTEDLFEEFETELPENWETQIWDTEVTGVEVEGTELSEEELEKLTVKVHTHKFAEHPNSLIRHLGYSCYSDFEDSVGLFVRALDTRHNRKIIEEKY